MGRERKLQIALLVILLLIGGFVVPGFVHLNRQKARLSQTLSMELGRDVSMGDISLRLLPAPGFSIDHGFAIADDPKFSAEPLLRADSVSADVRLSSLWRGRIEIAKISFASPSLNLVRNRDGKWNLESLLLRASQIPSAPTSQKHAEARPRFPYIEAENGRINFKSGDIKSPFALTEADFSFYLESDDRWSARLDGKPMRTDMPMSDTGSMQVDARLGRAASLGAIPVEGTLRLQDAQLGQISKLLFGADEGWRGALNADFSARGRLDHLQLASRLRINQFRRFDVAATDSLSLSADCSGYLDYMLNPSGDARRKLDGIACAAPLGDGTLGIYGSYSYGAGTPDYDLTLQAHALPAGQLALIYRNVSQNVASDLQAQGVAEVNFNFKRAPGVPERIVGNGAIVDLRISSSSLAAPVTVNSPVLLEANPFPQGPNARPPGVIAIVPFTLSGIGTITGTLSSALFQVGLKADAEVPTLLHLGRIFGMSIPFTAQQGHATGDLSIAGHWTGFQPAAVTGELELANVSSGKDNQELRIASAHLTLTGAAAQLRNLHASFPSANLDATGDIAVARPCPIAFDCRFDANLRFNQVDIAKLRPLLSQDDQGFFGNLFNRGPLSWMTDNRDTLSRLKVAGDLRIDHLQDAAFAVAENGATNFRLADGKLTLSNTSAFVGGGKLSCNKAIADFSEATPRFAFAATLGHVNVVSLLRLNPAVPTNVSGTLNADLQLSFEGSDSSAMAKTASGAAHFELLNGSVSDANGAFRFHRMAGRGDIAGQRMALSNGSATQSAGAPWQAAGSINFARKMELTFTRGQNHITVTGPLTGAAPKLASK
ncbi:MAG: AsmA family protein [Acidobacteriaceae bacterium]